MPEPQVVVVGAGPVGLAAAALLAGAGVQVLVLDRAPTASDEPRAVHVDDEAARVLQAAGVLADLLPRAVPAGVYEWRGAAGQRLLAFDRSRRGPSGWPEGTMFHQPDLERLLLARMDALGVPVRRGATVADVRPDADGAQVLLVGGERVRAQWVVAADGAGSTVRTGLGLPVVDLVAEGRARSDVWLVVDVLPSVPVDLGSLQVCDPARPTTAVPAGRDRRRFEFLALPDEDLPGPGEDVSGWAWELLAPWGLTPGTARLERAAVYRSAARQAQRWRSGRVLLAGDAAHEMPPYAGQGLCSGLRDAAALAWRLDLVLRGVAADTVLDSYGPERLAHVETLTDFTLALGDLLCVTDPQAAAERDAALAPPGLGSQGPEPPGSSVLDVPLGPGLWLAGDPLAGHLAPQGVLTTGGRTGLADDVLGRRGLLLALTALPEVPPELAAADGQAVCLTADTDVEGTYGDWLRTAGREVALLRPDGYVFGSGSAQDARGLAAAYAAHLRRPAALRAAPDDRPKG